MRPLFETLGPTAEIGRADDRAAILLPPARGRAFGLLDAATMPGLPERLAASDLPHDCLYRGSARERLADVAPWLVELRPDDTFLSDLLSPDDAPWCGWGRRFGWLVQGDVGLSDLATHFRRFTMTEDEDGRRYLFRFWDPSTSGHFLRTLAARDDEFARWTRTADGIPLRIVVADPTGNCTAFDGTGVGGALGRRAGPFRLDEGARDALRAPLAERDAAILGDKLASMDHFADYDRADIDAGVARALARRDRMGVRSANGLSWLLILSVHEQRSPALGTWIARLERGSGWTFDQMARMLQRVGGA